MEPAKQTAYQRLVNLPGGVRERFLFKLSYSQLNEICQKGKDKKASVEDKKFASFCEDPNFWQDYLLERGYLLPETFPELIAYFQRKIKPRKSQSEVIHDFFFEKSGDIDKLILDMLKEYEKLNSDNPQTKQLAQIFLDYNYLVEQRRIIETHQIDNQPYLFLISVQDVLGDIPEFSNDPEFHADKVKEYLESKKTISLDEILQLIADYEFLPFRENEYYEQFDDDLIEESQAQEIAMIPDFIREGDLVKLEVWAYPDELSEIGRHWYYYDGKRLHLLERRRADLYLPVVANSFLAKHNVEYREDLNNLYSFDYLELVGVTNEKNKLVNLPWRN